MDTKKPVGRPLGPVDPDKLHAQEIVRWIKVKQHIRELIEKQLDYVETRVGSNGDSGVNLDGMLQIMDGLSKLLKVSSDTIESGLKLLEKGSSRATGNEEDINEVLESIHGGKGG